jgi:hypothetical protein
MGQRFSLLHLLPHEQQLEIYREHADLSSQNRQSKRPAFEGLPPELRLMIFKECIREYERNSGQSRRRCLERVATDLCPECIDEHLFGKQPWQTGGRLSQTLKSIWTAYLRILVVAIASPGICLYIWAVILWRVWQSLKRVCSPANIPQTNNLHEKLVFWMLLKRAAMMCLFACFSIPLSILVVPFLPECDLAVETLKFCEEQDDEVYDLPIFYLNKSLRVEALRAARGLKYSTPKPRPRRKFIQRLYELAGVHENHTVF